MLKPVAFIESSDPLKNLTNSLSEVDVKVVGAAVPHDVSIGSFSSEPSKTYMI